jgi:hypothetical protein
LQVVRQQVGTSNTVNAGNNATRLTDLFRTVAIAKVDPAVLKEAVQQVESNEYGPDKATAYMTLEETITMHCPPFGVSAEEFLRATIACYRSGNPLQQSLSAVIAARPEAGNGDTVASGAGPDPESYFIDKPGELENAALPYHTQRSLHDGVRDLDRLTFADEHRDEVVSMGRWVYNGNHRWYFYGRQDNLPRWRAGAAYQ